MLSGLAGLLASASAKAIFGVFGDTIVQPILNAYLKNKDVDLEKFKQADASTTQLAVAVLDANIKFAQIKANYALAILQWWPFRLILWTVLAICATRFCLIVIDSTWWWVVGCSVDGLHQLGDVCSWSIPAIHGMYGDAEKEFLLFFVVAKPVDSLITGSVNMVGRYLDRK